MRGRCWVGVFCVVTAAPGQGLWERRADLPFRATEVSSAAIGNKVYSVCGLAAGGSTNALAIYDPRLDAWREGAPSPISGGADHCNVAAAGGKLYLLGAIRVGSSFIDGNTYEYDPAQDRWQMVGRMNVPRGASGVAGIGNVVYVAGGLAASGSVADFEAFDTVSRTWVRLPNMPTARDHLTAQAVNGRFYAISGRVGNVLAANEEFDPATNTWRARAPIPTPRGGLGSAVVNNRIVVFGGEGPSGTPEGTYRHNEEYDPAADTWRALAPMPTPRHGLYGAAVAGRVFAPAGGPSAGANFSSVLEVFYPPPDQPPLPMQLLNGASFDRRVAPGTIASLFGVRMSQGEQVATRLPLPERLNAAEVRVNGVAAPLLYVGPNQINFLVPAGVPPGPVSLQVGNAGADSALLPFSLDEAAFGIFTAAGTGQGQGAILIGGTGLLAEPARPARRGAAVEIYGTGSAPASAPVAVTIGRVPAEVLYAGPAPGQPGLFQVNARVPAQAPAGATVPVVVQLGAITSNTVTMAVSE